MGKSKLCKAMITGAIVGACVSMFDRDTREHTIETAKKVKDKVVYYAKNREELQKCINEKIEAVQKLYENASDNVSLIVDKIDEVKEIPNTIQSMVTETKDAFSDQQKSN